MERFQHKLFKELEKYLESQRLLVPGEKILLALSGGRDSVTLFDLLRTLAARFPLELAACHLDHGLRGAVSAAESEFVRALCVAQGVECRCGYADVASLCGGRNVEAAAREVRYAFLRETAAELGADCIATAHHADDQAETVLLHLLRGSGPQGLAAIRPREGDLIRPLLFASQELIVDYSEQFQLQFCQDASNFDQKYLRNKLRLSLLPHLAAEYNPRIGANLAATAEICRAENDFISAVAEDCYQKLCASDGSLAQAELAALPLALRRRVVRRAYQEAAGGSLTFALTEAVLELRESAELALPSLTVYRRGGRLYFGEAPEAAVAADWRELVEPSYWRSLPGGWQYLAEIVAPGQPSGEYPADCDRIIISWPQEAWFGGRQDGVRMAVPGLGGHKSVKAIYQEARVPLEERAGRPVLYVSGEPVWLPFLKRAQADCREGERLIIYCRQIENIG